MFYRIPSLGGLSPFVSLLSLALLAHNIDAASSGVINYGGDVPIGSKLVQVHVIYRHGDRNPKSPYPKSHYHDLKSWPGGWGELTDTGILQQIKLGILLKALYGPQNYGLLPEEFNVKIYKSVTTDVDRTIMSLIANQAGLWRSLKGKGIHEPDVQWNPTPFRVIADNKYDTIFGQNCSKAEKLVDMFRDERFEQLKNENLQLFQYAQENSGYEIMTHPTQICWLYDTLTVELLRKGIIPEWANALYPEPLESFLMEYLKAGSLTEEMRRLTGGPLLKTIITAMKNLTMGKDTIKMYAYSAHETSIYDVLAALCSPPKKPPGYTATLLFELFQYQNSFFLRILYRPGPDQTAFPMKIPGCGEQYICSLKKFEEITQHVLPKDLVAECTV
ncbi:lysosomal acid phosphatase-like [Ischnura elegans]|uniref:lysosomal acid phosphatase-like n=1 Tax=Ischnura elegans TaxID=197161 RepID=UPI001ED8AF80|nr:lysosomal acid phosphatase-like [Ischnura elegans]